MNQATKTTSNEDKMVRTMQLLGDKTRYKIFKLLLADQQLCVSEIAGSLDISVSAVSQHFRNFELMDLVSKQRNGQKICYKISKDDKFLNGITKIIEGEI